MAGSCIVAIESRKQAASRPSPPLPEAGVGLLLEHRQPVEVLLVDEAPARRVEEEVQDVVGERAADQELHGEVVDALRVLALVGVLGAQPALREDVPHGAGDGLVALARPDRRRVDDVVEHQMPLVERIAGPGELDRAAAVLLEQLRRIGVGPPLRPVMPSVARSRVCPPLAGRLPCRIAPASIS